MQGESGPPPIRRPLRLTGHHALLHLLTVCALVLTSCASRPPIPRSAVRMTLTVDGLLQSYADNYALSEREPGGPRQIAEAYLQRYQPGPLPRVFEHSEVRDRNGALLAEWIDEGRRTWIPLQEISPNLVDAILATEDASFFVNQGVDPHRLLAAIIQNASRGDIVSGASTITMQLARNLFFSPELRFDQSIERKGFEALLAQDLTRLYTKDEILELYLNLIYFGHNAYGVEAAAQTYFGKPASELSLAEASLLAGIPQAPALYDPFFNPEEAKRRQRIVLNLLVRHNYLGQNEADDLFAQQILLTPDPNLRPRYGPHFVQFVRESIQERLGDLQAERAGLRLTTTLDLPMQLLAERIVREQVARLRPAYDLSNAALVALKPGSAEVLVMVGSADFADDSIDGKVNVAASLRQPGSAIKPVLYATALNDNLISPATVLWDIPAKYKLEDEQEYRPRNYDEKYHGPVTARSALANSYNIPAIKLLDALGVQRMLDKGRAMGLISLREDAEVYGLSLTLGGGEVRLIDLATAFHTMANRGVYHAYQYLIASTDGRGLPLDLAPATEPARVLTPAAAFQVTSMLSDAKARAPAFGANNLLNLDRPAAAKTGTTTSYRDNWTLGYTRYLVAGVWAGNSDGRPMRGVTGVTGAGPIWHEFMQAVIAEPAMLLTLGAPPGPEGWEFTPPDSVEERPVHCPRGLLCPRDADYFSSRWLASHTSVGMQAEDVVAGESVRGVLADGRFVGGCSSVDGDTRRTLLRLPSGLGLLASGPTTVASEELLAISPNIPVPVERKSAAETIRVVPVDVPDSIDEERQGVISWTLTTGVFMHLGPCAAVEPVVRSVFGAQSISYATLPEMGPIITSTATLTGTDGVTTTVPPDGNPPPPQVDPAVAASQYQLVAAGAGGGCSGNQILGVVTDAGGAPQPGIRVIADDQYGNRAETKSKGGGEAGRFDFGVAGTSNTYYVTLLDGAGGAISATGVINHALPGEGSACYWVQFQARPG